MFLGKSSADDGIIINTESDYKEVLKLAEESNKEIILVFTGDNCSWCKKQKEVLSNKEVSNKLGEYVLCYVNVSKNKNLAKKHNVSSIPKSVIIDKNEKVLKESSGYKSEKEFIKWTSK